MKEQEVVAISQKFVPLLSAMIPAVGLDLIVFGFVKLFSAIFIAIVTATVLFFWNKYLKKRYPDTPVEEKDKS